MTAVTSGPSPDCPTAPSSSTVLASRPTIPPPSNPQTRVLGCYGTSFGCRTAQGRLMKPLTANPILVAGMHRSGTSALASLVASATGGGAQGAGPAADLANPAGYMEITPIVDFNREALADQGWFWDAPPATPVPDPVVSEHFVDRGRSLVAAQAGASQLLLKDPRFSLLMPLWRRVLMDRLTVVVSTRPALEVAWSLAMRD